MAKALSAKAVEAMKPGVARREIPDGAFPGLYLVVQPSGARSWAFRYRFQEKPKKLTLGRFPALPLGEARKQAGEAAQAVELGTDPAKSKQSAKAEAREDVATRRNMVSTLIDAYSHRHLAHLRSGDAAKAFLDRSAGREWADRDIRTIMKRDVIELIDAIADGGSPISANRTLAHLKAFFRWCQSRDVVAASPADGVPAPAPERSRDRVLTDDELRQFWRATGSLGVPLRHALQVFASDRSETPRGGGGALDGDRQGHLDHSGRPGEERRTARGAPLSGSQGPSSFHRKAKAKPLSGAERSRIGAGGLFFTTTHKGPEEQAARPVSGFAKAKLQLDKAMTEIAKKEAGKPVELEPFVIHDFAGRRPQGWPGSA